jgi:SSS family transporter
LRVPPQALLVVSAYLALITSFGWWLGRRRRSVEGYFLAGRSVPAWAVAACVVATETSTLTFIGVPGMAYLGQWTFLQLAFGYVLGRLLIAAVFIPAYFEGRVFTSYELLQQRFGPSVRTAASAIFLAYRSLGDGIRLHAAALVVAVVAGVPEWACVLLLGLAMIVYTEEGGAVATVWTDVVQMFVYLAGALVCLVAVVRTLPEGLSGALAAAAAAGKLRVIDASWDAYEPYTLAAGLVGGAFLTLATHGTDHFLVQRLLVARTPRAAAVGLAVSGFVVLAQFALFLTIGTLLWAHYDGRAFARGDEVLPTFVSTELHPLAVGLILAAIVAAALSPSLNSMASAGVRDFYLPFVRPGADEARQLRVGRGLTVAFGVVQVGVALLAQDLDSALGAGLAALSYASGPTVGVFLLGTLTRSATTAGALVGMLGGLGVSLGLGALRPYLFGAPAVAWTWNVAIGALATLVLALAASRLRPSAAGAAAQG